MNEVSIKLTEQEANILLSLLDTAVKSGGLNAAVQAVSFVARIQSAFSSITKPQSVDKKSE